MQVLKVAQARSFGDAVAKVLRNAQIDTTAKTLWLLHDDSRPADPICWNSCSTRGRIRRLPR